MSSTRLGCDWRGRLHLISGCSINHIWSSREVLHDVLFDFTFLGLYYELLQDEPLNILIHLNISEPWDGFVIKKIVYYHFIIDLYCDSSICTLMHDLYLQRELQLFFYFHMQIEKSFTYRSSIDKENCKYSMSQLSWIKVR